MATFQKFNTLGLNMAHKKHDFSSDTTCTLTVALSAAANAPVATNSVLADLTQISYTNLSSRVASVASSSQTGGVYKLVVNDLTLTASGGSVGPFRYVSVYDDDAASDELIAFFDYGSDLTLQDGESLTLDFDGTNGLFTLSFA